MLASNGAERRTGAAPGRPARAAAAVLVLLITVIAGLVVRRLVRPIRRLTEGAERGGTER